MSHHPAPLPNTNCHVSVTEVALPAIEASIPHFVTNESHANASQAPGLGARVGGGAAGAAPDWIGVSGGAQSGAAHRETFAPFGIGGVAWIIPVTGFPGPERDEEEAASDLDVIAAAQSILTICRNALADLSMRAFQANPNGRAVDRVDDAVNSASEIICELGMRGAEIK